MEKITYDRLQELLDEIVVCEAFELHRAVNQVGRLDFFIPYMMNDALECYLILTNGRMTGEYLADYKGEMTADVVETEQGAAVICHQGAENVFTVWFEACFQELKCYRYNQIGHFWIEGQEQWRRLVYIIGTIHDKYNYMGDSVCNELEKELMPLMEFAPFRYFSPIHETLDEYYDGSIRGLECMERLAKEAEDRHYLALLKIYRMLIGTAPVFRGISGAVCRLLVDSMERPGRNRLYQLIFEKVQKASMKYPEREYPATMAREIGRARDDVRDRMADSGFSGEYPLFEKLTKRQDGNVTVQVLAMEEHPFTVLESDQFKFRIQFMVSETRWRGTKKGKPNPDQSLLNPGFFKKKGNRGMIAKKMDFLL